MKNLKAKIWMIKTFGYKKYKNYELARKNKIIIDYSEILSPEELQKLEIMGIAPWLHK